MPYSVDTFSGSRTIVVEDGTIDSSLDVRLIGKNYAGYGEVQNENFLHLLENFSGISAPPRPINGQIWYDTSTKKLKFYNSDTLRWKTASGAEVSASAPAGLALGDIWWDESNEQLYIFNGSTFILVGPQGAGGLGATEMKSTTVTDTANGTRAIIQGIVNGKVMFIVSSDEFELSTNSRAVNPGFRYIKEGLTLVNTDNTDGITNVTEGEIFWGTASNAIRLGGFPAADYIKVDINTEVLFKATTVPARGPVRVRFADIGYTVGESNDLEVSIDSTDGVTPIFKNAVGNTIKFQTTTGSTVNMPLVISGNNLVPSITDVSDIGQESVKYNNIYGVTLYGNGTKLVGGQLTTTITNINASQLSTGIVPRARLSGVYDIDISGTVNGTSTNATNAENAEKLRVGGSFRNATVDTANNGTANTIAARDGSGNINAVRFQGTATSALFADLAEKYLADQNYEIGTVVVVGGEAEVTKCQLGERAFGAVSGSPAFMMNEGLVGGTYIALKGRVPVKVTGAVKKGDKLIAAGDGCAGVASVLLKNMPIRAGGFPDTFAIALETNNDPGIKLVEAIIL
jgi:hypothetical protein